MEQQLSTPLRGDRLLSLDEIAVAIDRTRHTVRWMRQNQRGPRTFLHRGRIVAYESEVRDWLRAEEARTARAGVR
ncbi:DNA-binding protein [Mycobacterium sp. 852013-51886_SCH5428379]|uniref:DNA-binding protein n=1 Tax=Mycobacterium sp. 852013-51886_SCH5428379 TaxID=1834111 RepID=UPI000AD2FBF5|nr:DNA-binding protein [Mycobacterium sp. 852013-51886_SCH5428379]